MLQSDLHPPHRFRQHCFSITFYLITFLIFFVNRCPIRVFLLSMVHLSNGPNILSSVRAAEVKEAAVLSSPTTSGVCYLTGMSPRCLKRNAFPRRQDACEGHYLLELRHQGRPPCHVSCLLSRVRLDRVRECG